MSSNTSHFWKEFAERVTDTTTPSANSFEKEKSVVFKPSWKNPPLNPIEKALIEGKKIAYYIPSKNANSYKLLALQSLGQWVELLKEKEKLSPDFTTDDKYEFVIGKESSGYNGDIDDQERVIINFRGSARLG